MSDREHYLIRMTARQMDALKDMLRESIIDRLNEAVEDIHTSEGAYSAAAELCELASAVAAAEEDN
jgi:hypothetical protein